MGREKRHAPSTTEVTVAGQTTKYILSTNDVTLEADIDYYDTAEGKSTTYAQTDVTAEGRVKRHAPSTTEVTVAGQTTKDSTDVPLEAELPDIDYYDTAEGKSTTPAQTDVTADGR